ncbi:MAG: hypothetical protein ACOC16_01905 [Nanoarchaeota archaeon]
MEGKDIEFENAIKQLKGEDSGKQFLVGFILGTINISLMIFFTSLSNKLENVFLKQFLIILIPVIMFLILILLTRGAFKIQNEYLAYGLIFATFFIPIFLFLTFVLFFVIL